MTQAKITAEQSLAVQASNGQPVYLVDDAGRDASLAIVKIDLLRTLAGDDFNIADTYTAQEAALSRVWSDPLLDEYTDEDGSPID
jgi:hypothetical protein